MNEWIKLILLLIAGPIAALVAIVLLGMTLYTVIEYWTFPVILIATSIPALIITIIVENKKDSATQNTSDGKSAYLLDIEKDAMSQKKNKEMDKLFAVIWLCTMLLTALVFMCLSFGGLI